jgi:hypothetical protein
MAKVAGSSGPRLAAAQTASHALGVAIGSLSMVMLHPVVGLPIAAAGLAALVYGRRMVLALSASAIAGALAGLVAHQAGLYVIVLPLTGSSVGAWGPYAFTALTVASLALVGPGMVALMRSVSPSRAIAIVVLGLSSMQAAVLWSLAMTAGQTVPALVGGVVAEVAAQTGAFADMEEAIVSSWPGLLVSMNAFTAVVVAVIVGRAGVRRGAVVRPLPPLARVDLDPRMAIVPIVAIALLAAGRIPASFAPALDAVGVNVLIVARWVFFLQGVAVFAELYERAGFSRMTRVAGYVLLGVTEALLPLVSLTGLADIWLNMRRLPRDGASPEAVETPPHTD